MRIRPLHIPDGSMCRPHSERTSPLSASLREVGRRERCLAAAGVGVHHTFSGLVKTAFTVLPADTSAIA